MSLRPLPEVIDQGIGRLNLLVENADASIDEQSLLMLRKGFDGLQCDARVTRIVLCGATDRFASGVDVGFVLRCLQSKLREGIDQFTQTSHSTLCHIARSSKPVIAWVDGPAFGGGLELPLACDQIVGGSKAKFSMPETSLGIYPGMGGTQRLPRRIGLGLAKWMVYTGSIVPVEHAWQIGLIDAISPAGATIYEALAMLNSPAPRPPLEPRFLNLIDVFSSRSVSELVDPSGPAPADAQSVRALVQTRTAAPHALRLAEQVIDRGITLPLEAGIDEELAHLWEVFETTDAILGLSSLGKARPKFTGT
jgi:enoyl-CoA hydratase/3-hydroxyacyl-CoA dehydrogenase